MKLSHMEDDLVFEDIDTALLSKTFAFYATGPVSELRDSQDGVVILNESIVIQKEALTSDSSEISKAISVDLDVEKDGTDSRLQIYVPREIAKAVELDDNPDMVYEKRQRARKSRKISRKGKIASISAAQIGQSKLRAAILTADMRRRELPLAMTYGPLLRLEPDGTLNFCYGFKLMSDKLVTIQGHQNLALRLLAFAFDDYSLIDPDAFQANPVELLRAITRKPKMGENVPTISIDGLKSILLPYQRESVIWCLRKEGKDMVENKVCDLDPSIRDYVVSPPLGWRRVPGSSVWVNPYLLRTLSRDPEPLRTADTQYKGKGLLAEEMGLGKTVELISLILLNQRPVANPATTKPLTTLNQPFITEDQEAEKRGIKATLVIVPRTILHQWAFEVKLHAPDLHTLILQTPSPSVEELSEADIVLVTYDQLSRWLPYTKTIRRRERRNNRANMLGNDPLGEGEQEDFGIKHSTLIDVEFWRVILDEVQMVHTGSSAAALVARRIPRVHAWAASGTPVKHSLEDLRGITYFLDLKPFVEPPCWQRLISSPVDFQQSMETLAIRHTKAMVSDQLELPKQHRRLLLLKFSAIEAARYNRVYREFRRDSANSWCNWSTWLHRIRQTCSHTVAPGSAGIANFGSGLINRANELNGDSEVSAMTLGQILTQLIDDADLEVWSEQREKLNLQLQLGQLLDISYQMPKALAEWKSVVDQVKDHLTVEQPKLRELLQETEQLQISLSELEKKMGSEIQEDDSSDDEGDYKLKAEVKNDPNDSDLQQAGDAKRRIELKAKLSLTGNYLKTARTRCKSLQELLHRTYFFLGTGYFRSSKRLKISTSEEDLAKEANQEALREYSQNETLFYDMAESVRNDILNQASERVRELIDEPEELHLMNVHRVCRMPKSEIVDNLSSFVLDLIEKLRKILTEPLIEATSGPLPEAGEVKDMKTGSETDKDPPAEDAYSKTLDLQEYAYAYLEMLQIVLRDRTTAINGGNLQSKPVATFESVNDEISGPLLDRREDIVSLLQYERTPITSLMRSAGVPGRIINDLKGEIRQCQTQYSILRDLYNARVEYYKQLQDLSDQVTDIDVGTRTDYEQLILQKVREINRSEHAVQNLLKNQSYLRNLGASDQERSGPAHGSDSDKKDGTAETATKCTICLEPIETGVLTACLHYFCEDCLMKWVDIRHSCPLCNKAVRTEDVQVFRSGEAPQEQTLMEFGIPADGVHASDLYAPISEKLYRKIYAIPTVHSYGIKIDMIVRHVKYLRSKDPTTQIVVFSQWGTMLKVLRKAFAENEVVAASTAKSRMDVNEFRTNPQVACLLLHAKADVAGLTLVNASHVFLCEPLMNTSLELQAVSRINRIGQTRETTVWQFCVENTVEQTILGLTTQSRLLYSDGDSKAGSGDDETENMAYPSTQSDILDKKSGEEIVNDKGLIRRILIKE